jgi:hypothetical protein
MSLPVYRAVRYVIPLREGGSLPAVLETEEAGLFVVKFRGAGQGARALVAELIVGLLAQELGLPVPELALIHLDESFGRTERDPEIQDILKNSRGLNMGIRYLDGAFNYEPLAAAEFFTPELAADVVWYDALVTNVDRTPRNPNIMIHQRRPWLIDHGAALYFHHDWISVDEAKMANPFPPIRDHVLLPQAGDLNEADARMAGRLDEAVLRSVLARIPDELLMDRVEGREPPFETAEANREAYLRYFMHRLRPPRAFVEEAAKAQKALQEAPSESLPYRR